METNPTRLLALIAAIACLTGVANAQFRGAVYAGTNALDGNGIAAFGQNSDGTLTFIDTFATGGLGSTEFDGGEGLDPLISADSIITDPNQDFLFAVNAGSDTISSFRINNDFSLSLVGSIDSGGVGPNSLAYNDGRLFVSNIDRDGFAPGTTDPRGEPNDEGNLVGFNVADNGALSLIAGSTIDLDNRPANIGFSADGGTLLVTSINSGSNQLAGPLAEASLAAFSVNPDGTAGGLLGANNPVTSTLQGNAEGRNLPSAIDFDTTTINGREFVVVTEAREFNSVGDPPALPALQAGSVSVYELTDTGLVATETDFALGDPSLDNQFGADGQQLTACWIDFGPDGATFYVSNAINSTISSFTLNDDGTLSLIETVAAEGNTPFDTPGEVLTGAETFGDTDGFIDLDVTDDGEFLYQLEGLSGNIGVYQVTAPGALTFLEEVSGFLPAFDTQGIVTVSAANVVPEPAAASLVLAAAALAPRRRRR